MFVQPELPHLASTFAREGITVVPLHDEGEELPLPNGVELNRGLAANWKQKKIGYYLWAPTWPGFGRELWCGWRQGGWLGVARVWRWAAIAKATWQWLQEFEPPNNSPLLIYTYWRGGQTMAAVRHSLQHPPCEAVSRVHRYELYKDAFSRPFQPWTEIYEGLRLAIPIAQHGVNYLLSQGIPAKWLRLSRLGVPAQTIRSTASTDGVIRLVSCSSITQVKRLPFTAQTIVAFAHACITTNIYWTHFGEGPERHQLQAMLQEAPANLHVNLRGQVANAEVIHHYATQPVDLFVLLSASEGLPVSIQEALSMGIPVLATDVGGVSEAVDDSGNNGMLVPPHASVDLVVQHLKNLLIESSSAQCASRREAAWNRWAGRFDAQVNHRALAHALYNELD
jgi:hypothetical protein